MTRRRLLDDAQATKVVAGYESGSTIDELASQFGVSSTPIRRVLSDAGVEFRRRSWREVGLFDVNELVRRYEAGESKLQLARELNVNTMSVHRRLVAAGVKIDSKRRRSREVRPGTS